MPATRTPIHPEAAAYKNPRYQSGPLSVIPKSFVPYCELMRLELPHGNFLGYFPHLVGLLYGSSASPARLPANDVVFQAALYIGWTFFMRGAGCAWNDVVDQDFDRKTTRCRVRPVARGAVSTTGANIFALAMVSLAFACISPLPAECQRLGLITTVLSIIYPFCKRVTNFAQVILGMTLAINFILAAYGAGLPAVEAPYTLPTICVTTAITLLVVFYDVVYARQDTADDLKSGVKGMAVLFRNYVEILLTSITLVIAGLLATTGVLVDNGPYFFVFSVAGLLAALLAMIGGIRYRIFHTWNSYSGWFYALAIFNLLGGYLIEYLDQVPMLNKA
ncbi:UbiA prenyltransferase family-domain-containing protein [Stachybotrys elegans]|uniref:UbiA prenyltransferase family-domain-containing protein n=1 Tax=Stachybotrys elegans TaxID=80388 RepID=A0A8K0SKV0_9HYPO|nr:UbiA prenyltransferase family-domain-containing protein [Stachybotrys elegans]